MKIIKVIIVDDSQVSFELLSHILSSENNIEIIGWAKNGNEAFNFLKYKKPDVITLDIHMPGIDGFEVTRQIMAQTPCPIVIISSVYNSNDAEKSFQAVEAGAVAILQKPVGLTNPQHQAQAQKILETVKVMAGVKVVTRFSNQKKTATAVSPVIEQVSPVPDRLKLIAIGASTGGPPVIQAILHGLPKPFPLPILIVQHITPGFLKGMADWLEKTTRFPVVIPSDKTRVTPGTIYLAPDDCHMGLSSSDLIRLSDVAPENGLRPAVSYFFRSVADVCGHDALAILLTGMGNDGSQELKLIRNRGGITIAQDQYSSVVHGMPGEAIKLGAAEYILPPPEIINLIIRLTPPGNSSSPKTNKENYPSMPKT